MRMRAAKGKTVVVVLAMALSGCRAIVGTAVIGTAAVVGTAGVAGYTVYRGGSSVVSKVGSTVGAAGSSVSKTVKKKHKSVVVSRGTLKARSDYSVAAFYSAGRAVFADAKFTQVVGRQDSLAATIRAKTAHGESVFANFELYEKSVTAVELRVGEGNLKQSEYLYDEMLSLIESRNGGKNQ